MLNIIKRIPCEINASNMNVENVTSEKSVVSDENKSCFLRMYSHG